MIKKTSKAVHILFPGLLGMFLLIAPRTASAKDVNCFKRQMDGWAEPAYYLPDESGNHYDFLKDLSPYRFRATGGWKSYRMGQRNDNFQKGICSI